jgi:hypothetical protein
MVRAMRGWMLLVIAAACSAPKPHPAAAPAVATPAPAPATPAPAPACDTASIQPMLDANAALSKQWGDGLNGVMLDHVALVPAHGDLVAAPGREPVLILTSGHWDWHGSPRGADAVVLAVDGATPWNQVVNEAHELGFDHTLRFAFAVDQHDARLVDNPLRAGFDVAKARAVGADFQRRCPQAADLFMAHDDGLAYIAAHAHDALASCGCAVTPAELAQLYDVLFGLDYVAVRTVSYSQHGTPISAKRTASFASVAPMILAAHDGAQLAFTAN